MSKNEYERRQKLLAAPLARDWSPSGHRKNGQQRLYSTHSEPVPLAVVMQILQ